MFGIALFGPVRDMMSNVCCSANPFSSILSIGARLRVFLLLSIFCDFAFAVPCIHCKNSISGCTGGDECPLVKDHTANLRLFEAGTVGSVPVVV